MSNMGKIVTAPSPPSFPGSTAAARTRPSATSPMQANISPATSFTQGRVCASNATTSPGTGEPSDAPSRG